jgi:carboxyl-terminal processing protease
MIPFGSLGVRLMVVATLVGLLLAVPARGASDKTYEKLDVFAQVLQYVQNSYVDDVDSRHLLYGAIRGMLKTLDPHSTFMTPDEFKSMQEDTSGHFGGVGLELEVREHILIVVAPIDDTPAHRAGILAGDQIVKIDGASVRRMNVMEATRRVKGVPGTKVVLTVDRDAFDNPKEFVLIRQRIRVNPIEASMPLPGYALVRVRVFTERTERYMMDSIRKLRKKSGGKLKGMVLDLRNNPGGLLAQAVRVADRFIAEGLIVETRGRTRKVDRDQAHKQGTEPEYPLICLVNGGSASASEIVAGALQDHGRALVMGVRSFGKGSVQTVVGLKDGSGLKLTVARYYTPKLRSIQERGIVPDVIVPRNLPSGDSEIRITREADLDGHLKNKKVEDAERKKLDAIDDYQLRTALYYLRAWERFGGMRSSRAKLSKPVGDK